MTPVELALLTLLAFATSILSAVVGMAGGIVLLSAMVLFLEPLAAIPLHGAIQLVSNGSRALIQRRHVNFSILLWYGLPLLPAAALGLALVRALPAEGLRLTIGVFVLVATWAPAWLLLGAHPEKAALRGRFLALGCAAGVLNMTVGAIGPFIAPFFLNLGLTRQSLIGTKAAAQTLGHTVKILLFGAVGFAFADYALPLALLAAASIAGTWVGSRLLDRVSERAFVVLYKTVLTLIAARLVIGEGLALLGATGR